MGLFSWKPLSFVVAGLLLSPALAVDTPTRVVLTNGIPLVLEDTYSAPTVSINIYIRVGSVFETPEQNGISHFYEHMFFRGTPTRSGLDFKRQIEALGGVTNANTGKDFTHFYINLPKQYVNEGLDLLADAYLNAEVAQTSVDAERDVVLEEYRLGKDQPIRIMSDKLFAMMFKKHPYGRNVIGSEQNLKKIGRAELLQFKHTYYVPDRTKLVVVGDIDKAEVIKRCQQLFGSYTAAAPAEAQFTFDTPPPETVTETDKAKMTKTQILYGFLGPSVKDKPDVYRMDVLAFMLGMGKGSLFARELDPNGNESDDSHVDFLTQAYPGAVIISASAELGKEDEVSGKLDKVIKAVQAGEFTEKDIARARILLTTTYRYGNESNAGKADGFGTYETIDKMDFAVHYLDLVNKVSKADLVACAQKYFGRNYYRLISKGQAPPKRGDS